MRNEQSLHFLVQSFISRTGLGNINCPLLLIINPDGGEEYLLDLHRQDYSSPGWITS
jgi:hypothetical protein